MLLPMHVALSATMDVSGEECQSQAFFAGIPITVCIGIIMTEGSISIRLIKFLNTIYFRGIPGSI